MTHEETKAMVEKLKTTWTAFGGLSKEEQEFLRENPSSCVWRTMAGTWCDGCMSKWFDGTVYRLSPDFVLPEEKPSVEVKQNQNAISEWTALAKAHSERVSCEAKCIVLMLSTGMSLEGKTFLPDLEQAVINLRNSLQMIQQYVKEESK